MIESIYDETRASMGKSVESLKKELNRMRTGRASLSILDGIKIDYYGTLTPLNQTATLAVPESRLITIQPWDVSVIKDIEKAILKSDLGLTPSSDGKIIRIINAEIKGASADKAINGNAFSGVNVAFNDSK